MKTAPDYLQKSPSMIARGHTSRMLIFAYYLIHILFLLPCCQTHDTIVQGKKIEVGDLLISANGNFVLGFWEPGYWSTGSTKFLYVSIWYKVPKPYNIVWVANMDNPIQDYYSVLTVRSDGNLAVLDGSGNAIWSTNVSALGSQPINERATLLDSGNLVLRNNYSNSMYLWQSFHFPSHALLPGMRISFNVYTGCNTVLRSWRDANNPGVGIYSFGIDPQQTSQLVIWRKFSKFFRTGVWDDRMFGESSLVIDTIPQSNQDEISYIFTSPSMSLLILDVNGKLTLLIWNQEISDWHLYMSMPYSGCSVYNGCGENNVCSSTFDLDKKCSCLLGFRTKMLENTSRSCEREIPLECGQNDEFVNMNSLKLPDMFNLFSAASSVDDCEKECRKNCSCTAYAFADVGGGKRNCLIWQGYLVDLAQSSHHQDGLFIRLATPKTNSSHKGKHKLFVTLGVVIFVLILLVICSWSMWILKVDKKGSTLRDQELIICSLNSGVSGENRDGLEKEVDLPIYSFATIAGATDSFAIANKLGEGGFGSVYKGILMDGQLIAVKRLSRSSRQGIQEFKNEVILICKLQHRNLVRLLGCCIQGDERILIYEYMSNKSLDTWLFDKKRRGLLGWPIRVNIVEGIIRGLHYLHHDSRLRIIHRDLKASNILLDEEMNPKLSDFGMARIFGGDQSHAKTNRVVGTYGYMPPEYAIKGLFSMKSDVFSFGVLLLEILSGKRNTGCFELLKHAWRLWNEGAASEFADSLLQKSCPASELSRYIHVGLLCVQENAECRPSTQSLMIMLASEEESLPVPKEPHFLFREKVIESKVSSSISKQPHSVNEITLTQLVPR